jgi:hypothetical protein
MMSPGERDDELEVSKKPSGTFGRSPSARGGVGSRPAGPARDLRSARLGIKRALRDRRAGRLGAKEFERIVNAHKTLARIALRALEAQEQKKAEESFKPPKLAPRLQQDIDKDKRRGS